MTSIGEQQDIGLCEVAFGSDGYKQTLAIRDAVLRKPIGMELRAKDTASDPGDYHFAAFGGGAVIGCVLFTPRENGVVQLRQMAVLESHRGRNIGAQLVKFAEQVVAERGFTAVETRAWRSAEGFYRKAGYQSFEHVFSDEHTLLMRKSLR
jgi:GNAT superfamily N-acetyltransferase